MQHVNDNAEVRRLFSAVWTEVAPPGRLLCGRLSGSRGYGTARPESDHDWAGVYVGPTRDLLALAPPEDTINFTAGEGRDWTFHEARKFLLILGSANANTLEALFMPADAVVPGDPLFRPLWEELVAHRRLFLTQQVLAHYVHYANSQLMRVRGVPVRPSKKRPNKPVDVMKDACHGLRLLFNAREIARGEEPSIRLSGGELATVKSVRTGHVAGPYIVETADNLIAEINGYKPWPLPEDGPTALADDWLFRLRRLDLDNPAPAALPREPV